MNTGLRHVVVTRFNIAGALSKKVTATVPRLDPDWLEARRVLFERFCLPSMKAQTMGDYEWIVLLDLETPDWLVEWFMAQDDRIQPLLVSGDWLGPLREAVRCDGWLATTRLDGDDALHREHLETVHSEYLGAQVSSVSSEAPWRVFVDLTKGLSFNSETGELRSIRAPSNAFVSLVEYGEDPETVCSWKHKQIAEHGQVIEVEKLGWLQVIHGGNALSKIRGEPVAEEERDELLANFGLIASVEATS